MCISCVGVDVISVDGAREVSVVCVRMYRALRVSCTLPSVFPLQNRYTVNVVCTSSSLVCVCVGCTCVLVCMYLWYADDSAIRFQLTQRCPIVVTVCTQRSMM